MVVTDHNIIIKIREQKVQYPATSCFEIKLLGKAKSIQNLPVSYHNLMFLSISSSLNDRKKGKLLVTSHHHNFNNILAFQLSILFNLLRTMLSFFSSFNFCSFSTFPSSSTKFYGMLLSGSREKFLGFLADAIKIKILTNQIAAPDPSTNRPDS